MTRPILTDTANPSVETNPEDEAGLPAPAPTSAAPASLNSAGAVAKPPAPSEVAAVVSHRPPDALAGALPEWDLLPHVQFVKRVKRQKDSATGA